MNVSNRANKRIIAALTVAVLAVALSCEPRAPRRAPATRRQVRTEADVLNVFFTGNSLGKLKPCGCSGGQLGGLERRPAVLNSVPMEKRLLIDTGSLVETDGEQDLIKFNIIVEALGLLDYDLVNLTEHDLEIAENLGLVDNAAVTFISPYGIGDEEAIGFQNRYLLNNEYVTVSVLTFDVDKSPAEQIKTGFVPAEEGDKTINILIVSRCDEEVVSSIASLGIVDCIVCPSDAEEPGVIGSPNRRPLVFSVGRYGRYICSLKIEKARVRDRFKFKFAKIRVDEYLEPDAALTDLYKGYQQIVRDRNLVEAHPRYPLPNGLKYVGSQACKECHESAYEKWHETGHAHAYKTLVDVGSEFDPECVVCHVVGMDYEGGFISAEQTGNLKNVDCENCHGPGSKHVESLGEVEFVDLEPKSACIDCHTPEHSGEYAGNEQTFLQKIIHPTEPNAPGNVK